MIIRSIIKHRIEQRFLPKKVIPPSGNKKTQMELKPSGIPETIKKIRSAKNSISNKPKARWLEIFLFLFPFSLSSPLNIKTIAILIKDPIAKKIVDHIKGI